MHLESVLLTLPDTCLDDKLEFNKLFEQPKDEKINIRQISSNMLSFCDIYCYIALVYLSWLF